MKASGSGRNQEGTYSAQSVRSMSSDSNRDDGGRGDAGIKNTRGYCASGTGRDKVVRGSVEVLIGLQKRRNEVGPLIMALTESGA